MDDLNPKGLVSTAFGCNDSGSLISGLSHQFEWKETQRQVLAKSMRIDELGWLRKTNKRVLGFNKLEILLNSN